MTVRVTELRVREWAAQGWPASGEDFPMATSWQRASLEGQLWSLSPAYCAAAAITPASDLTSSQGWHLQCHGPVNLEIVPNTWTCGDTLHQPQQQLMRVHTPRSPIQSTVDHQVLVKPEVLLLHWTQSRGCQAW